MATEIHVLFNNLSTFANRLGPAMSDIVAKLGHDIEAEAKGSMEGGGFPHVASSPGQPPHVDTGHLKDSIRFAMTGEYEGEVAAGAEYAAYLEFGTSRMAARPFMTPAVDHQVGQIEETGAEIIRKAIP